MRNTKYLALLLIVPALGLTACGSDDKGSSDKDQLTSIINDVAANPAKLCDVAGKALLEQAFSGSVADCKKAAASSSSDGKATIKTLDVSGDTATATVTDKAGTSNIKFAKQDGDWKVTSSEGS
jgi:hypothetical protein